MPEGTAPPESAPEPAAKADTVARGAALTFAAKLLGGAFTAALTVFLARKLGSTKYGIFALGMSIVALLELPSDFGVSVALPRFLAEHRSDRILVPKLVADAIRLEVVGSLVVAGSLAGLAGVIADAYGTPGLALVLRALALALVGQNFLFLFSGVFAALRRQALTLWSSLLESAIELTASVSLVLIAGGASAAAFGRAIGYAVGAAAASALAVRLLGPRILPRSPSTAGNARRIAGYAGMLWVIDSAFTLFTQIDSLLIGAYLANRSVAFFQAPMRLITVLQYPGYAIATAVSPRVAGSKPGSTDAEAFDRSIRALIVLMAVTTVITTVWAAPIIRIVLGRSYDSSAGVLRALAPYVFLSGGAALASTALNYLGAARRRVPIAIFTVVVNLLVDLILIPRIGVIGGAVGSDIAYAIYVLAQFGFCVSTLGLRIRPHLITLVRCAVACAPAALVLVAFGTSTVSAVDVVLGALACLAVYGVALVALREVTRADLALLGRAVRSLRK
jgi:O-antigen/teichoic acid export membrane protein